MDQDSTGFDDSDSIHEAPMPPTRSRDYAKRCIRLSLPRRGLAGQLPDDVIELPVGQIRLRAVLRGDVLRQMLLVLHVGEICEIAVREM